MNATLTSDERRLMRDVFLVSFAQLLGPAPEILTGLVRKGFLEWRWNDGFPIYEMTEAGRAALAIAANYSEKKG